MRHPTRSRSETISAIIDTAGQLFRVQGYHKTTVSDIARELGMSQANIYRFFRTKREINEALAANMLREVETQLETIAGSAQKADARLVAFVEKLHELTEQRYISELKVHDMVVAAINESWPVIDTHLEKICAMISRIISDGIASADFPRQDVEAASLCVHAAIAAFTHPILLAQLLSTHDRDDVRKRALMVAHFCLTALRCGFQAPAEQDFRPALP